MARSHAVVTGGAGFLGSHLCDRLLAEGYRVIAIDNLITGDIRNIAHLLGNERFKFVKHDVTEYIFIDGPVDYILHFASPASPDRLPEAPDPDAEGRLARHAQGARPREGEEGAVPAGLDVRGLRRPARSIRSPRPTGAT